MDNSNPDEEWNEFLNRHGKKILVGAVSAFAGLMLFIGGHIYIKKGFWSDDTFYVPGEIHEYYNSDDNSIDGERGTGGKFGFPIDNPELVAGTNELLQKFEWKMIQCFVDRKDYEMRINRNPTDCRLYKPKEKHYVR